MPPWVWKILLCRKIVSAGRGNTRRCRCIRKFGVCGCQRPGAIIGVGSRKFVLHVHIRQFVLDGLIARNRATEGVTLERIGARQFQAAVCTANLFEGKQDRSAIKKR